MTDIVSKIFIGSMLGAVIMLFLTIGFVIIDEGFIRPHADQNALDICEERGFDSFESYSRTILSKKALGVRCSHIRNAYEIDGSGIIAVSSS